MKLAALFHMFIASAVLLCIQVPARAILKPDRPSLPNLDRRFSAPEISAPGPLRAGTAGAPELPRAGTARALAVASLRKQVPTARVDFDPITGSPKFIAAHDRLLTGPAATPEPALATREFIKRHRELFEHGPEVLDQARLIRDYVTPHNQLRTAVWQQQLDGIPVFEAVLLAHVTRSNELVNLSSLFVPDPAAAAERGWPDRKRVQGMGGLGQSTPHVVVYKGPPTPHVVAYKVAAAEAVCLAADNLGESLKSEALTWIQTESSSPDGRQQFTAAGWVGPIDARLVWLPLNGQVLRLCWQVILTSQAQHAMFRVLVDSQTGEIWVRHCLTKNLSDATYRVFTSDSPSPFSPGHPVPTPLQPPLVDRSLLTFSALDTNASPRGWIEEGENQTCGNNVDAYLDRNSDGRPDLPRPQGNPQRVFDFPLDLREAPESYGAASVVQLFYWCNWMHDRLYQLGFTEAAGNFQCDNLSRGGLGQDALLAEAQDGGWLNNAMISVPPDGMPPRMEMFLFDRAEPDRDSALDAEVVLHEYAHGLTDRLVGGGVGLYAWQSAGLAEGWSDFYGLTLLSEATDDVDGTYGSGAYLSYLLSGLTENYYYGIRRYPYSTDLAKNPLTFKDIDPGQASMHSNVPLSPRFRPFDRWDAEEVHCQGEVWCAILWELRANLIRKHGFAAGNQLVLQTITDALRLSPPNPDFVQARDAILLADLVNEQGANLAEIWGAFARRGLGLEASSPGSWSPYDVRESFDAPGQLLIFPGDDVLGSGPVTGPFTPAEQTIQLFNTGAGSLNWAVGQDANWLQILPTGGNLPPGSPATNLCISLSSCAALLPAGCYTNTLRFTNLVTGATQSIHWVLRIGQTDFLTEWFRSGHNDLAYHSVTFTPDGSTSYYSVCIQPAHSLPVDPLGGERHWVGDDGFSLVQLSSTNQIALFDIRTNAFFVSGNGVLTLERGDSSYVDCFETHFALPRISASFQDFDTEDGDGEVGVRELPDRVVVTFLGVSEYGHYNRSTFQVEWFFDGLIRITYLEIEALGGIVGLSRGNGVPPDFHPTDFTRYAVCGPALQITLPAQALESDGTLREAIQVELSAPVPTNLLVAVTCSDPARAIVPAAVMIPAGATGAFCDLGLTDDALVQGAQRLSITAAAPGFQSTTASLLVLDDEVNQLALSAPPELVEGGSPAEVTLTFSAAPELATVVYLDCTDRDRLLIPRFLILPPGQTNVVFSIRALDNYQLDTQLSVRILAEAPGWPSVSHAINLIESRGPALEVTLPEDAFESQGTWWNAGSVRLSDRLKTNLVVQLESSDSSELTLPLTVLIPPGQSDISFDLGLIDDAQADGPQRVTVTARAPGFQTGTNSVLVHDGTGALLARGPEPVHGVTGVPVTTAFSWQTSAFESIANGGFEQRSFSGWSMASSGPAAFRIDDGRFDPPGPDEPLAAAEGAHAALLCTDRGAEAELSQEIALPAHCRSAVLSWRQCIRQGTRDFGYGNYRVELRDTNNAVLATALYGDLGNWWDDDWRQWTCDLSAWATQKVVRLVFVTHSEHGLVSVRVDDVKLQLQFDATAGWNVFLAREPNLGPSHYVGTTVGNQWQPPPLEPLTTYYWKVDPAFGGQLSGAVWQFTTRGPEHFDWQTISSPQYLAQPFYTRVVAKDELGRLVTNFNDTALLSAPACSETILFGEDFEQTSLLGWDRSDTSFVYRVTTATAALGARSLSVLGGCRYPCTGLLRSLPNLRPDRITFHVRAAANDLEGGHLTISENSNGLGLYFFLEDDGTMGLYDYRDSRFFWYAVPYEPYRWYKVSIVCHWAEQTVDLYVDDALAYSAVPVLDNLSALTQLNIYNSVDTETWWDGIEFTSGPPPQSVYARPTTIGAFTNGVWSGFISVEEPALQVQLTATDQLGYHGTSLKFDVLPFNDLGLSLTAPQQFVTLGQPASFQFLVTNSGPALASGLVITSALPAHVQIVSGSASQGTFRSEGSLACFDLGAVAAGGVVIGTVVVLPSVTVGVTNHSTLTGDGPDNWSANNSASAAVAVLPTVGIADLTLLEGNSGVTSVFFPVTLSSPTDRGVALSWSLLNGTATPGLDFFVPHGRLVFPPGITSNSIPVQIRGDIEPEPTELFRLRLIPEQNAVLGRAEGTATIEDDDEAEGQVHHFSFGSILSPQEVNLPFPLSLAARTLTGATAEDFNGPVSLEFCGPPELRSIGVPGSFGLGFPFNTGSRTHRAQAIYRDVGAAGRITSLALQVTRVPGQTLSNWTIRLKHTALEKYGPEPVWDWGDWTIVCQTNWTINNTGWATCVFSTPFDFNGRDNLMIDFSFNNPSTSAYGICSGTDYNEDRTLTASTTSDLGNPLAWTGGTANPSTFHSTPDLLLEFRRSVPDAILPAAVDLVQGVWTGMVTMLEPGTCIALMASDTNSHVGVSPPFNVVVFNDLALSMTAGPDAIRAGEALRYTLLVTNTGPATANQVTVTNFCSPQTRFVSATASQGSLAASTNVVIFSLGSLPARTSATLDIELQAEAAGFHTNSAVVSRAETEAYHRNNSAVLVTQVMSPCVVFDDVQMPEGSAGPAFCPVRLRLSGASPEPVRVRYSAWGDSASLFQDFLLDYGELLFAPGQTETNLLVRVLGDSDYEADEQFRIYAYAMGGDYCSDIATITLLNDDPPPTLQLSDAAVTEGESGRSTNGVFVLRLSAACRLPVLVDYCTRDSTALAGSDYAARAGTVEFLPGVTERYVGIAVHGDALAETDETFFLRLSNVTNAVPARTTAACVIWNDDGLPEDLAGFDWSSVPSPQFAGHQFAVNLRARNVDGSLASNFVGSAVLSAVANDAWLIRLGVDDQWDSLPLGHGEHDLRVQLIYPAAEIGRAGHILSLALDVIDTSPCVLSNFTVGLKHTSASEYVGTPAWDNAGWSVVFQADLSVSNAGWTTLPLATPFAYDGTNSLMVDFSYNQVNSYHFSLCRNSAQSAPRTLYAITGYDAGDPLLWSGATPTPVLGTLRPNLKLEMVAQNHVTIDPSTTEDFRAGQWTGTIAVTAPWTNVLLVARDAHGHTGLSLPLTVEPSDDSDADDLPDAWELAHFGSLSSPNGGSHDDPDQDGANNRQEYIAGTDPLDPGSRFAILSVNLAQGSIRIRFATVAAKRYQLQMAAEPDSPSWTDVGVPQAGTGGVVETTSQWFPGFSARLYRVQVLP